MFTTKKPMKNICLWTFMATMKEVEFVKIANTILKASIVIVVKTDSTDQQTKLGMTPTFVNVSIHNFKF